MSLLTKMLRRGPGELLLAAEAFLLLLFFRACLTLVPVRRIIGRVTNGKLEQLDVPAATLDELQSGAGRRIQWAVRAAARHSPVEVVCFPQTLAGYVMLRRRGCASTIVYGIARSPSGELLAHTWLEIGDAAVVGGEESVGFSPIERWR